MVLLHCTLLQKLVAPIWSDFFVGKNFASVDACDEEGETPLFYALRGGHKDVVEVLLEYRCNYFHQNNDGENPIDFCVEIGEENLKQFIIQHFGGVCNRISDDKMLAMSD